jgi:putative transposase
MKLPHGREFLRLIRFQHGYLAARNYRVPVHLQTVHVEFTHCGRICICHRKVNLSQVFAGQNVGIKEISEKIWHVTLMHYDLGFFDEESGRVECAPNPFTAKVSPMSPE